MLSYTVIKAPKAGRVVDRLAQVGDTIRPGDSILVLYDETSLRLEAAVPERLVARMSVGDQLQAYVDARKESFAATVDEIVPQADAKSRSFLVKATLPRSEGLFEGLFGRLRIPVGERRHLCVSTQAIQHEGQLEYVDLVTGERRMIKTGKLGDDTGRVEVLSGLDAGEEVVIPDNPETIITVAPPEKPSVDVSGLHRVAVEEEFREHMEEAVGTLRAATRTVIASRLLAVIDEITVAAGDQVQQGDVLVRLQDSELRTREQQAEQALRAAEANREDAEKDLERNQDLYQKRAVSKSTLEESDRRVQVTRADEQRAEQAVEEARVMLSYTVIKAPKAGRVVDRLAQVGDTIRPGDSILVLYDATSLRLEAAVPERLVARMSVGDQLQAYIDAREESYAATVDEIVPQADAKSRSFLVKAALPRSEGLFEGLFGRLRIPVGERRHLYLPSQAIQHMGQLEFVNLATGQRRMIKTGNVGDDATRVEVLSGLNAGEEVVIHDTALDVNLAPETE